MSDVAIALVLASFVSAMVVALFCFLLTIKYIRLFSNETLDRLRQSFLTSSGYRDNADEHIDRLRKLLIAAQEAYGQLLTQPPEERFKAYIEELQELLKQANDLASTADIVMEVVRDLREDDTWDHTTTLAGCLRDLGKSLGGWSVAKNRYLRRSNGPSPTENTGQCPSCGREVEITSDGVPPHRKLYSDLPCDGGASQDPEVGGTKE